MSEFPTQAQVVIIGGGVGGCSIAYHLTKLGWKDVLVLEKHELTSGSTWHSAGLVGQMRSDANLTRMMHYSTDLYRSLKSETGQDTSWREVGGIRLAASAERMEETKRLVGMARSFGVPMDLISPKEAQDMFPLMDINGVVGAAYTPNDGSIDPTGLTNALAIGAKNRGARFFTNTIVEKINLKNGRISEVVTLDVCEPEPLPQGHPFWSHPRIWLTPHVASATQAETAAEALLDNLRRHDAGLPLEGLVDRSQGY
jgi:4-methylaminobutanoate oxidase (formaldehyde-forming)